MENFLLCCDWGTSSLRLRLISLTDHELVGEVISQEGIAKTFSAWQTTGKNSSRNQFFCKQLKKQITALSAKLSMDLEGITVVISGMASSSIGMEEVPYAVLPFATDGSQANTRYFDSRDKFPHEIVLISGVQSRQDVMRGEETQLVGLLTLLDDQYKEALLIFPGTHSKHLYVRDGHMIDFKTFMTGEIFNLLAHHSILKDSVKPVSSLDTSSEDLKAFTLGVKQSMVSHVLNGLFTVRTNQILGKLGKKQNSLYLSGLLIGSELRNLLDQKDWPIILCSDSNLHAFYKLAIEELELSNHTTTIAADLIDQATIAGQVNIFRNHTAKYHKPII